jgi:hypothetical protein
MFVCRKVNGSAKSPRNCLKSITYCPTLSIRESPGDHTWSQHRLGDKITSKIETSLLLFHWILQKVTYRNNWVL